MNWNMNWQPELESRLFAMWLIEVGNAGGKPWLRRVNQQRKQQKDEIHALSRSFFLKTKLAYFSSSPKTKMLTHLPVIRVPANGKRHGTTGA
jgi:hypothetical protein